MSGFMKSIRGDCSGNNIAAVWLYANNSTINSNCDTGSEITTALDNVMTRLENDGRISAYTIQRYKSDRDDLNYPRVDVKDSDGDGNYTDDIFEQFNDFLTNGNNDGNGSGFNLKNKIGVHLLVHDSGCSQMRAGAEGIGIKECSSDFSKSTRYTAFSQGGMATTGVCNNVGLRRNSAIQEVLHLFIRNDQDNVSSLYGSEDEHSLGWVDPYQILSPMLTYHVDDNEPAGDCKRDTDTIDGYTDYITTCTSKAVGRTANEQCDPNDPPCS